MAYIGATPSVQTSTPAVDYFSGNGSTTQFTLSRNVSSTYQMVVIVANVPQNPSSAYTVLGNVITFTSAPPAGSNNIWVYYTSFVTQIQGITQNPVISGTVNANAAIFSSASGTAPLTMNIAGAQTAIFDSNGNFGLGSAPSSWGSGDNALQINKAASFWSQGTNTYISNNLYYNGSNRIYTTSNYATEYQQNQAGTHIWSVASSGTAGGTVSLTNAMTLDNSGNLGLGGAASGFGKMLIEINSNTSVGSGGSSALWLYNAYGTANNAATIFFGNSGSNAMGAINFVHQDYNNYYGAITFDTRGSGGYAERMRIDSNGYVGIGTSSPSSFGALAVRKGVSGTWLGTSANCSFETSDASNNSFYIYHNTSACWLGTDAGTRLQMVCSSSGTGGVYLSAGGNSWTSVSDERAKENLVPIENGLTKVVSLRAVTGNYINDADKTVRPFLIAQDVHTVLPEAVNTHDENEWGLAYTDVIPLLVASIKELKAINDTQASTITQLQADVATLQARVGA
jgi:hypothetical protein